MVSIAPCNEGDAKGFAVQQGTGPSWEPLINEARAAEHGVSPPGARGRLVRVPHAGGGSRFHLFTRLRGEPVQWEAGSGGKAHDTAFVAAVGPGGPAMYRMNLHSWTPADFRLGAGFTGTPQPPSELFYPFTFIAIVLMLSGVGIFAALPGPTRGAGRFSLLDGVLLAAVAVLFSAPLFAVGGSVQALTRAAWLTLPCWILAAVCMHLFAKPTQNARLAFSGSESAPPAALSEALHSAVFVRTGAAFLAVAVAPVTFLVFASLVLWQG